MSSDDYVYIVFCEAERRSWWMKLLKRGFSHCYMLVPFDDKLIMLDFGYGQTILSLCDNYQKPIGQSIMIKTHVRHSANFVFLATCVSTIKLYIGLGGLCVTPYQLYKRLKNGTFR